MSELKRIKKTAIKAAKQAGDYAFSRMGKLKEIKYKDGIHNLVTDVDKDSEKMIIELVNKEFSSHSILAEESGAHQREEGFKWIIDPLDGTTNFAHGFPIFCVSIGVAVNGTVKIGVVYDPTRKELFVAEEGKGATLNGVPIKVSEIEKVQETLIATGFAYNVEKKKDNIEHFMIMLKNAQAVRRPGSAAIDLCYVACGRVDGFWEIYLSPWDTAAGQLMVKEAGGNVTDLNGNTFDIYGTEIVATNSRIHEEMLVLLGSS